MGKSVFFHQATESFWRPIMKIALALSGGGFRATVFHLGVLSRLAEEKKLEDVNYLSTVSGGSLSAGLVFALSNFTWPSSLAYNQKVLPKARQILTQVDLQGELIKRTLTNIFEITDSRADDLSILLRELWGINYLLKDLPASPRWLINATCYETGKNWRFERFRMGDYQFGYTYDMDFPLRDAIAASAGFPGLIGALKMDTSQQNWFKYKFRGSATDLVVEAEARQRKTNPIPPAFSPVHLWDGGVYDNHGLEGLYDFISGWREDIDFLIVSDAAGRSKPEAYSPGIKAMQRLLTGIMMDQVRSLRARSILERIINHGDRGGFLQIGNTCKFVLEEAGLGAENLDICHGCLDQNVADQAAWMGTDIAKLDDQTFELLYRHGFEVADYTLYAYNPDHFHYIGYRNT
jgi:NTE family protein